MSDVRATLEAFAAGELDYAELHRRLNAALAAGLSVDAAVADLDAIRDADGLSVGLYNVLYRAITRVSDGEDTSPFAGSGATTPVASNETDTEGTRDEPDVDAAEAGYRRADELPQMFTEPEALLEDDLPEVTAAGPAPVGPTPAERDEDDAEVGEASGSEPAEEPTAEAAILQFTPREAVNDADVSDEPIECSWPLEDPEFRAIAEKFAVRLCDQLRAMRESWTNGDLKELAHLAHWLKGSGGTAGYGVFTEPAANLEAAAKSGRLSLRLLLLLLLVCLLLLKVRLLFKG